LSISGMEANKSGVSNMVKNAVESKT